MIPAPLRALPTGITDAGYKVWLDAFVFRGAHVPSLAGRSLGEGGARWFRRPRRNGLLSTNRLGFACEGHYFFGCDTTMRYRLEIKEEARQQLRALSKGQRRNVGRRLDALQIGLSGDVKKLTAKTQEYRLRVGTLRVLFTLEKDLISVYAVKDRKKAYG